MVYLKNIAAAQQVQIPNNGLAVPGEDVKLLIYGTITKTEEYTCVASISESTRLYYAVEVNLPRVGEFGYKTSVPNGQYEYRLTQGSRILSTGLLQIGEFKGATRESRSSEVTFMQGK